MLKKDPPKGFTLVELVLAIALIGILAVSAIPRFTSMTDQACIASVEGVAGAVRSGIMIRKAERLLNGQSLVMFPLDQVGEGQGCDAGGCFSDVLQQPVLDPHWRRAAANGVDCAVPYEYDNCSGQVIRYTYNICDSVFNGGP